MPMEQRKNHIRVCYMGIARPEFSRSGVYIPALRKQGLQVLECFAQAKGTRRFVSLFKKHWPVRNKYDLLIVAYPGYAIVWFARLLSRKPIVFDALCTLWEAETFSHKANMFRQLRIRFIDQLSVWCASVVLVESEAQKNFFLKRFGGDPEKYQVVYTGVDESVFSADVVPKLPRFTVVFRGRLTYESGIEYVVQAAKLLESEDIFFRIIGYGYKLAEVNDLIEKLHVKNVEIISQRLSFAEMKTKMAECHVSIGQLSDNKRLERTIPHKAFESLALRLPYVTAQAGAVGEILKDGKSCVMIPAADSSALAGAIVTLRDNPAYAESLQKKAYDLFERRLSQRALGEKLVSLFAKLT